jgi:hypothetical protein
MALDLSVGGGLLQYALPSSRPRRATRAPGGLDHLAALRLSATVVMTCSHRAAAATTKATVYIAATAAATANDTTTGCHATYDNPAASEPRRD